MSKFKEYIEMMRNGLPNIDKIAEAILTQVKMEFKTIPEDEQEEITRRRLICASCPLMSVNAVKLGTYQTNRSDPHCTICKCPITTRTASLSSNCGIENYNKLNPDSPMELKWTAYTKNKITNNEN